ncbi:hypothetical protein IV203_031135 [Nitzschia inconspicua]|uniref:Uncharacterized protein n=1 Tax=Nitzschia inconspicua TaxID=303405 RepID=A0A9K3LUM6_9STRA|nr:hypothetical protein IV203_031135 [Nitzschia inconspicua]
MAPLSNTEHTACYYDDEDDLCVGLSSPSSSSSLQRKSSLSSSKRIDDSTVSVSFAPEVAVYAVLHINDYSLTERRDTWYGAEEMRQVRQEWKEIVQMMEDCNMSELDNDSDDENEDYLCVRGLEGKTSAGKRRRRQARSISMEVVLDEQVYQEIDDDSGLPDPIMIAMAYHECTFPLQVDAFRQAQKDARAVGQATVEEVKPNKFDFRAVRSKYLSESEMCRRVSSDDATVATTLMADNLDVHTSSNVLFHLPSTNHAIRKRFSSCFIMPLTPKRYARRRPRSSTMSYQADV